MDAFLLHIAVLALMYCILAVSYNLLFGYLGITSLAHGAFWGFGAYASALTATELGWSWLAGAALGMAISVVVGALVAMPAARLRDEYLLICTVGFQVVVYAVFLNWQDVTRGALGIRDIPRPSIFGGTVQTTADFALFGLVLLAIVGFIGWRSSLSPFGRLLKAIREDEIAARSLGKDVIRSRVATFAVTGGLAALAGSFLSSWVTYIDPSSFVLLNSFLILTIVAIGGAGNFLGPFVGVVIVIAAPELLRLLPLPGGVIGPIRQILIGLILVGFMMFRPAGILPEHRRPRQISESSTNPVVETTGAPDAG